MDLRSHLASLPVELYDIIYDFTFTANPGIRDLGYILSNDSERSFERVGPHAPFIHPDSRTLLQISSSTRAKFAASYYGGEGAVFLAYTMYAAQTWLKSLDKTFVRMIAEMRVLINVGYEEDSDDNEGSMSDYDSQRACEQSVCAWFGEGTRTRPRVVQMEEIVNDEAFREYGFRTFEEPRPPARTITALGSWNAEFV